MKPGATANAVAISSGNLKSALKKTPFRVSNGALLDGDAGKDQNHVQSGCRSVSKRPLGRTKNPRKVVLSDRIVRVTTNMTNGKKIVTILAGCLFFGIAMVVRDYAWDIGSRMAIAGIGGLGLGVAIMFAQRDSGKP